MQLLAGDGEGLVRPAPLLLQQAALPTRLGGLGLGSPQALAQYAWCASVGAWAGHLWHKASGPYPELSDVLHPITGVALEGFRAELRGVHTLLVDRAASPTAIALATTDHLEPLWTAHGHRVPSLQHEWSSALAEATLKEVLQNSPSAHAIRIAASAGEGAGAWLNIVPANPALAMPSAVFQDRLHFLLGLDLPYLRNSAGATCPKCAPSRGELPLLDPLGRHVVACPAAHSPVHEAVVASLVPMLLRAGLSGVTAHRAACLVAPGTYGDIVGDGWGPHRMQRLVVDVTVVSPTEGQPGAAALHAESVKFSRYGLAVGNCATGSQPRGDQTWYLVPFAVETHGRLGGCARALLRNLADRIVLSLPAESRPEAAGVVTASLFGKVSVALQSSLSANVKEWARAAAAGTDPGLLAAADPVASAELRASRRAVRPRVPLPLADVVGPEGSPAAAPVLVLGTHDTGGRRLAPGEAAIAALDQVISTALAGRSGEVSEQAGALRARKCGPILSTAAPDVYVGRHSPLYAPFRLQRLYGKRERSQMISCFEAIWSAMLVAARSGTPLPTDEDFAAVATSHRFPLHLLRPLQPRARVCHGAILGPAGVGRARLRVWPGHTLPRAGPHGHGQRAGGANCPVADACAAAAGTGLAEPRPSSGGCPCVRPAR